MYIPRALTDTFHSALKQFPAILITGSRQTGKSTFLQNVLSDVPYVTFDDPLNREFALQDPNAFLDQFQGKRTILDEIQYIPEILPYIKIRIDKKRKPGVWVMTGSQQFSLMKGVSETLAGRIAILELMPFSLKERRASKIPLEELIWTGCFPEPACYPERRDLWLKSFIQTYLERDVRQIENIRNFRSFETFVQLCAAHHAQEFHPARLAGDSGVSQPTISAWSKIMEASYLSGMLPAFYKNFGKRVVKSPKFYFSDSALVCFLTRQPSPASALRGGMGSALFEGMMISEVWKAFFNTGQKATAYYWRSHGGLEVDLLIQAKGKLWPVEIKLTSTPSANHVKPLNRFKKIVQEESSAQGVVVCNVKAKVNLPGDNIAIPWFKWPDWLKRII